MMKQTYGTVVSKKEFVIKNEAGFLDKLRQNIIDKVDKIYS
jgi:hypothetical protein